jgi:hypothetical protein
MLGYIDCQWSRKRWLITRQLQLHTAMTATYLWKRPLNMFHSENLILSFFQIQFTQYNISHPELYISLYFSLKSVCKLFHQKTVSKMKASNLNHNSCFMLIHKKGFIPHPSPFLVVFLECNLKNILRTHDDHLPPSVSNSHLRTNPCILLKH